MKAANPPRPNLPIALDWQTIAILPSQTRVVMARNGINRFAVFVFAPDNTMHQLPIFPSEETARVAFDTMVAELVAVSA